MGADSPLQQPLPLARSILWSPGVAGPRPQTVPFPIFLEQPALTGIHEHVAAVLHPDQGSLGFLVGDLRECPETNVSYLVIDSILRFGQPIEGDRTADVVTQIWDRILDQVTQANGHLIGWYHTHPDVPVALSEHDVQVHERYFTEPWQVALVIATAQGQTAGGFFRATGDEAWHTTPLPFYELLDEDSVQPGAKKHSFVTWMNHRAYNAVAERGPRSEEGAAKQPSPSPPPRPPTPAAPPTLPAPPLKSDELAFLATLEGGTPPSPPPQPPAPPSGKSGELVFLNPTDDGPTYLSSPPPPPPRKSGELVFLTAAEDSPPPAPPPAPPAPPAPTPTAPLATAPAPVPPAPPPLPPLPPPPPPRAAVAPTAPLTPPASRPEPAPSRAGPREPANRGGTAWLTPPDPVAVQGNDALILEEGFAAPAEPPAPPAPPPPPPPPPVRARHAPPTLRRPGRSRRRVWLALFVLVAGAAGAVVYSRAPVFLALGVRIPALVRQALKALPPQTWRSHTAARLPAPSPAAPRRSAPPSSRPPVRLSPPVEQPGAAVAQAVRSYNEEAALFNTQHDCTELARRLRAVEDRWIAYTRRHSPGATLDAARARRDQAVYASVDSVERRFETSGCPRRP